VPSRRLVRASPKWRRSSNGGTCAGATSQLALNRFQERGCSLDEPDRLLRLAAGDRVARALFGELTQSLALDLEDVEGLVHRKTQDALHGAVVVEAGELALDGHQVFVALQLLGNLQQFTQDRAHALALLGGEVRPPRGLDDVGHDLGERGLDARNLLEI